MGLSSGKARTLAVALTAVAPRPHLVEGSEELKGRHVDDEWLDDLRGLVRAQASPMRTTTTKPWYRRRVAGALAAKVAKRIAEG